MNRTALALSLITGVALSTTAGDLHAQQARTGAAGAGEAPIESRPVRPNRYLLGGGAAIFGLTYLPGIAVAATSERDGDNWLFAPVIGPWGDLFDREGCGGDCGQETIYKTLLIASGLGQLVGVTFMVSSLFIPESETRIGSAPPKPPKAEVHLLPVQMGRSGYGLGVGGRF